LKIETQALEDQQTKLIAEIDSETLERYKRQAARKISQKTKFPGFRPGKAPYDLVRRMYGDEALQQEAIELMLDEVYPQVLQEANITPSGPGKLEEIIQMDPPTFAFVVPLPPSIELGNYNDIRKEYEPEPITDEQVEQTIRRLQRGYATAEPVERAAQEGDMVSFTMSATHKQPAEGEETTVEENTVEEVTLMEDTPYQMVAGEDEQDQGEVWPYEGFSKELIGLSANESKTVVHTFSEETSYEDLRGKETTFIIQVQNIKELQLPELNDDFAQSLGEFESMEALRTTIRQQLEQNYTQQYDQNYFDELVQDLVSQATVKYPPHMLEEEIEQFLHGVEHNLERDRLDLETYLKMREMDRETFIEEEVKPAASRRLERSLVLEEFARQETIELNSEEIRSVYQMALQQMQQSPELHKMQSKNKQSAREMANNIAMNTVNSIFNQRLVSRLKAIATGKGDEPVIDALTSIVEADEENDETPAAAEVTVFENITEEEVHSKAEQAAAEASPDPEPVVDPLEEKLAADVLPVTDDLSEAEEQVEDSSNQAEDEPGEKQA
jgi:trigger factor